MSLDNLTSITDCPRCGFTVPIYPNLEYVICKNCEKKINLNINEFEGEKEIMNNEIKSTIEMEETNMSVMTVKEIDELFDSLTSEGLTKPQPLKIRIKYFEGATKLKKITKGNWIDVYSNKDVFVPIGERAMIPLGFALELPQGWEGHLAPRSSTFKTWGVIQTNHVGIVDDSYIGDNDQWHMPVYCLQGKDLEDNTINGGLKIHGTWIKKGDKIGQFRIMEVMPEIEFEEVETFGNADRGAFGTTGTR